MATNQRDIELRIAATASGSEQVNKLQAEISALAKEGGLAAPEFERLSAEIAKIGQQGTALQALDALEQKVAQTSENFTAARQRVDALGVSLNEQREKTEQYGTAVLQANAAVRATEDELRRVEAAQRTLRAETDRSEKSTVGYKDRARELAVQLAALRNTLSEQRVVANDAKASYDEAQAALKQLSNESKRAETSATRLEGALSKQREEVVQTTQTLNSLGIETTDVATSLDRVEAALASARAETVALTQAQEQGRAIIESVTRSNERAVQQAKRAAAERAAAARSTAAAEAAAAKQAEFGLLKVKLAEEQVAAASREAANAAKALDDTFTRLGVRSAPVIHAEIDGLSKALIALKNDARVSGADFDRAFAAATARVQALERELQGLPNAIRSTSSSAALLRQSLSQVTAAFGLFELGRGFITANTQLETMRRSLTLINGSGEVAAKQIQFLKEVSDRAGLSYGALAQDFINFSAAANTSGIALSQQRAVFEAVGNAAGQLGISTDRVGLILQAFAQTASKGKVSLEELQGQLGESLPGALAIVADGFGVTKAQLLDLVKSGIDVDKFFDAFVRGSNKAFGDGTKAVTGFAAEWNRLKNTLSDTATFFGNEGGVISAFTAVLNQAAITVRGLGGAFELLGRIVGITGGAIATFDITAPVESMRRFKDEIAQAANEIQARLDKANGAISASADSAVNAQNRVSSATATAASGFDSAANSQVKAADAANTNTTAQQTTAAATAGAGQAANASAASWAQLTLAFQNALKEAENQVKVTEKLAQAKKIEGESRLAVAQISGNEAQQVRVAAEATKSEADALAVVARARQAELDLLIRQRDALQAEQTQRGDPSGARTKEINELNQTIAARTAEVEAAGQSANASRLDAEAKQLAAQTYADNSARLDTLRQAYDSAREALLATVAAQQRGLATLDQVAEAQLRAAKAEALYKDAVSDTAAAVDAKVKAIQGTLSVTEAQIALDREKINTEMAHARAIGDSYTVLQSTISLKELDIKLARAKQAALEAEARALREEAQAALASLDANDPLLKQKKAEIELRLQNAKVKELEAQKSGEVIRQLDAEIEAIRRRGSVSSSGADSYVSDREREADSMDRVRRSTEAATAAERERQSAAGDGRSPEQRERLRQQGGPVDNSFIFQLRDRLERGDGFSANERPAIENALRVAQENAQAIGASPVQSLSGVRDAEMWVNILRRVLERTESGRDTPRQTPRQTTTPSKPEERERPAQQTFNVKIDIGGRSTTIGVASQADAQRLTNMLQHLSDEANRSAA